MLRLGFSIVQTSTCCRAASRGQEALSTEKALGDDAARVDHPREAAPIEGAARIMRIEPDRAGTRVLGEKATRDALVSATRAIDGLAQRHDWVRPTVHAGSPHTSAPYHSASHHARGVEYLERAKGFEPSTPTLARLCSTPELHPHRVPATAPCRSASYAKRIKALQQLPLIHR